MRNLVYCAVLSLVFCAPLFAAEHFIGRTLEPTGKLVSYPVRHPKKTAKGFAKGVAATAKAVF